VALGGIRAGYLLGSPEVASKVQALLPPSCLPAHTAAILEVVLAAPEHARGPAEALAAERDRVFHSHSRHPSWRASPSAASFLLARTPDAEAA